MTCIPTDGEPRLLRGRPAETKTPREDRCYDLLDRLDISYDRVDHAPADTIALCHQVETVLGCPICKNLLLTNRQQTDFYLLLLPGDKVFKTKYLSKALGCSRLSFATGEQMEALLDTAPGSLSVLGLGNDSEQRVRLVIDSPVLEGPQIGCHPCKNTSTLRFSTRDLLDKLLPALGRTPVIVALPTEDTP